MLINLCRCLFILGWIGFSSAGFCQELKLYISLEGNDAWSGRLAEPDGKDGPFATLERARDEIRKLKPKKGALVELRQGLYPLDKAFVLKAEDSGTEEWPVVYRACPGEEVRIIGGRAVHNFRATDFRDTDRGKVVCADLGALGDFGEVATPGNRFELFFNDKPMTLARWPNHGFVKIKEVREKDGHRIHGIQGSKIGKILYEGDRPERWLDEDAIWFHGYWFWDWSDTYEKAASIRTEERLITFTEPYHRYGYRKGQRYYAMNLLAELDMPGEWYLHRKEGILYFWPPESLEEARCVVSVLPNLISMEGCSHVRFEKLILEVTRSTAVLLKGGRGNLIAGCTIRNTGGYGVQVDGGERNGVVGCDIFLTGEGGIRLKGGDRKTLTPGENFAENNRIYEFGRIYRTYRPAVMISGVGNRIAHNLIHHGPHNAIQLSGNDHIIEFNEIHHVCFETGDVGAFYMGRDWTMRGTVIRHNYFHHISGPGLHGAMAVYLDDAASGIEISGNLFYKAGRAAFIGGGRDNLVQNNLFVDCTSSVHVDARGLGWMIDHIEGIMKERLLASPYESPPWKERYPQLLSLLLDEPGAPKGNRVVCNISVGGRWLDMEEAAKPLVRFEKNLVDRDPHFVDAENLDFRLQEDSPAFALGFKPIPLDRIGPYNHKWRASWPVR